MLLLFQPSHKPRFNLIYANKIEVNWDAVPCAIAYRIYRNGVYLGTTTFTQTTFDQLTPGQSLR